MPRLNLLFTDDYFTQLQENAAKKGISLARYARDLIDIGLQVETATMPSVDSKGATNNAISRLDDTKELWKNSLLCVLESRYLIRYLVDNLTTQPDEKREAVLSAVKEKAQALVTELIQE